MKIGKPIAQGRTAEIYAWEGDQVLKLFRDWMPAGAVATEARVARAVLATGYAVPEVGDEIEVEGRWGILYERVDGPSMGQLLSARPWLLAPLARRLAELHLDMHSRPVTDLPVQRQRLEAKIRQAKPLPDHLKAAALNALQRLPEGDRLCHGDFHPGNILMTERGPVIIDWVDATCGNPLADVARTAVLALTGQQSLKAPLRWLIEAGARALHGAYLRRYFEQQPEKRGEYEAWIPVVAAARLDEGIRSDEPGLLALVQAGLGAGGERETRF